MLYAFVSACVYGFSEVLDPGRRSIAARNQTVNFVHAQIGRMPRGLRTGIVGLMVLSALLSVLFYGRLPTKLAAPARAKFLVNLAHSRFGPFRDLARLLTSFTAMGLFSHDPEVA